MSSGDIQPRDRRGRWSRLARTEAGIVATGSPFELSDGDAFTQGEHFGVSRDQILHDFVISHVLSVLEPLADRFVFYGGTALSRTILDGLRLSEDIDMLSIGPRAEAAHLIDQAVTQGLQRGFGRVTAELRLPDTRTDTTASVYRIGDVQVKMQLIDGQHYTDWPLQRSAISQRYSGIRDVELTTYTAQGFVGAKTAAWCDTTRNAPRDLYDLWALTERGHITPEAAVVYRKHGPTGGFPQAWAFPKRAPSSDEWYDALGHQCIPDVTPDAAFESVVSAWESAVRDADAGR